MPFLSVKHTGSIGKSLNMPASREGSPSSMNERKHFEADMAKIEVLCMTKDGSAVESWGLLLSEFFLYQLKMHNSFIFIKIKRFQ